MQILSLSNFTFGFRNNQLFKNASCSINMNEIVALTGINGCGKSTLLKIIFGLLSIGKQKNNLIKSSETILISQDFPLHPDLNLKNNYNLLNRLFPFKNENELYNLDEYHSTKFKNLSSGNKTKALLNAFLGFPLPFKLLDEPTEYLDENAREKFLNNYNNYFDTAIIATHDRNLINAICTHEIKIVDQQFSKISLN